MLSYKRSKLGVCLQEASQNLPPVRRVGGVQCYEQESIHNHMCRQVLVQLSQMRKD